MDSAACRAAFYPFELKVDSETKIASHDLTNPTACRLELSVHTVLVTTAVCVSADSPAFRRDSETDELSRVPPMPSPKLRRSITPEEHKNLVEQQLLQWSQQSRKRQHDASSSADQGTFAVGCRSSPTISSNASASSSRIATTCSTASSSTTVCANLSGEQLSTGVVPQVSVGSCRPRRIMTMVTERATPVMEMRCPGSRRQAETIDSETKGVRAILSW